MKYNKGKKNTKYNICLIRRGHVNFSHFDIVVKLKKKTVERLGYTRWYKNFYLNYLKEDRLKYWVKTCNVIYSKGFKRVVLKILYNYIIT